MDLSNIFLYSDIDKKKSRLDSPNNV